MFKDSIRKFGLGAASFGLAVSIVFPSVPTVANAASFLPPPPDSAGFTPQLVPKDFPADISDKSFTGLPPSSSHSILPQNYAGTSQSSEPVTVIVELSHIPAKVAEAQSSAAKSFSPSLQRNILRSEHTAFNSAAARIGASTGHEYTEIFNGYAVTLPGNQVDKLLSLPGVKAVYPNQTVHALETESPALPAAGPAADDEPIANGDLIGSDVLNKEGITGDGIKVAVIDTGIDYDHPYLKGSYKGGYDIVDNDNDPFETKPDPKYLPVDGNPYETSHGTHVSGIVKSVAPKVDIYAYRVLGPYGSGSNDDVIKGIELAVQNDVDVINLSLGSAYNHQYSPDSIAVDNAVLAGVSVSISSGNSGPGAGTVGAPGGSHLGISVGATTTPAIVPVFSYGTLPDFYGNLGVNSEPFTEEQSGLPIVFAGLGSAEDFSTVDVKGKIALVDRGVLTFALKSENAAAAGAAGLLIANHSAGELTPGIDLNAESVPTYGITKADGAAIKSQLGDSTNTLTFKFQNDTKIRLADLTSRGPALPDYVIRPDVVAPGLNVLSSVPVWESKTGYSKFNGTSMASPHVAGAAALLLDWNGQLQPDQIKALLSNNATPLTTRDDVSYPLNGQGAGLINLPKTIHAPAIAHTVEFLDTGRPEDRPYDKYSTGLLSFGLQEEGTTVTKTVYWDNLSKQAQEYDVSALWLAEDEGVTLAGIGQKVSSSQPFDLSLNIAEGTEEGVYEALVLLTESGADPDLSLNESKSLILPLSVVVGDSYELAPVTDIGLSTELGLFSPNGDGILDEADLSFAVNETVENLHLEVASLTDPATVVGDVYAAGETFYKGTYEYLKWDGTVTGAASGQKVKLEDGYYTVTPVLNDGIRLEDEAALIIIDTESPVVSGITLNELPAETNQPRTGLVTGKIVSDLLVDLLAPGDDPNKLFGVAAIYEGEDGKALQANGLIAPSGEFGIEVPLAEGLNEFYIYVYDYAGNGQADYAQLLRYNTGADAVKVTPAVSSPEVEVGKPVTVSIGFSATDAVYGASFNLAYSGELDPPVIVPSVQLATYQEAQFPGVPLSEYSGTLKLADGRNVQQYGVHLTDGAYSGSGSLAEFVFTPQKAGTYSFVLSDVLIWNDGVTATVPAGLSTVEVKVVKPTTTPAPTTEPTPEPTPVPTATPVPQSPYNPYSPSGVTTSGSSLLKSGQLTVTADAAGGLPAASYQVSEAAVTAALKTPVAGSVVIDLSDVKFSQYAQVGISFSAALAETLKTSGHGLVLQGGEFALLLPAAAVSDFITTSGLTVTLSQQAGTDTAAVKGSTALIDIGSSLLTIKNGWTTQTPVSVQLALNKDGLRNVSKTAAYQVAADNTWSYLQAGTLPKKDVLQFVITGDGTYGAASFNTTFKDIASHWAKQDVEVLAAHGIVAGKGTDGSFKPGDSLNQAELLTLFDRLLEGKDTWSSRIKENGARDVLTREEAAVILAEALDADLTKAGSTVFRDAASISPQAVQAIAYAVGKGYLQGEGSNTFNPKGTLTRAQAAAILHRVLDDLRS
ncbi:S8 family serine peptidase [Paenibacillus donghaensis]|nr:S8 family serine peptidase [Paenibacillus donghaensis]